MTKILDSNGVEIKPGDIIECPELPTGYAERYHVAYKDGPDYEMEIRDLGNNNVYMYDSNGPFYNIGHFTKHLDKLSSSDLQSYFGIDPEQLKANRCRFVLQESEE